MKFKNSKKKIKSFIFFSVIILILTSLAAFIALFFNKPLNIWTDNTNNSNNKDDNSNSGTSNSNDDSNFMDLEIAQTLVNKTNISSITFYDNNSQKYYFSKNEIENNISNLIDKAISLTEDFNDDISNFMKNIKFKLANNNSELTINLYLYSKLIKQKKYKSFFKLLII